MKLNPNFEIILAAIIWGSSGVFVKYLHLPSTTLTFFRTAVPSVLLLLYLRRQKIPLFKGNIRPLLLVSFLNPVVYFLYFTSFNLTSIGNSVLMNYTWPFFAALFGAFLLKEQVSLKKALLLLLSFLGIVVMFLNKQFTFGDKDFVGMSAMLFAALFYALTVILLKRETNNRSQFEIVFYQNIVGALIFTPFLFLTHPSPTIIQFSIGTMYAVLNGLVAYILFFAGLKFIKASTASVLSYIEVVSGFVFAFLFFREAITINMLIGGSLIIISSLLIIKEQ